MDIAALSMGLSQAKVGQAVGISVLKMAQEQTLQHSQQFIQTMQQSAQPHLGQSIDFRA